MSAEFGSDPWLDARLRDVPLPPGLLARLEEIAATSDDEIDEIVREVPVPADLPVRLSRIPRTRRRQLPWRELSVAAALLIGIGYGLSKVPVRPVARSTGNGSEFVGRGTDIAKLSEKPGSEAADRQAGSADDRPVARPSVKLPFDDPRLTENWRSRDRRAAPSPAKTTKSTPPTPDTESGVSVAEDSPQSTGREHDGILAAPRGSDRLPPLETVNRTVNRGLAPPLVVGYDLLYQLKTGERPFVSPEGNPALASSPVPLTRNTSSYLLARESIAAGHLPPADEVRIEDFLAALDGLLPPSGAPLSLHLAAGPAPFGESGLQLLEVGLRVGGPLTPDPATGAPRVVARGATLTVAFNPKVVQAYRLVGHATTTLTGPVAAITKIDLTAGAELGGLFELWLKPTGGDDVATIDLAWHDVKGNALRHMGGRVNRAQFAKSFGESTASLQAVALAAETARTLRSHAAPGRGLGRVLDLAGQVQPQLRSQESFGQLMQFVVQAEKVRANPGAGARRAAADSQP